MNFHHLISSAPHQSRICRNPTPTWQRIHQQHTNILKSSALFGSGFSHPQLECQKHSHIWKVAEAETKKFVINNLRNEGVKISRKKGSTGGAVALIIRTSIGTSSKFYNTGNLLAISVDGSPVAQRGFAEEEEGENRQ